MGSEMCIRDRLLLPLLVQLPGAWPQSRVVGRRQPSQHNNLLGFGDDDDDGGDDDDGQEGQQPGEDEAPSLVPLPPTPPAL